MSSERIRAELVEILDRLASLPNDAFAERSALRDEQQRLRQELVDLHGDELATAKAEWDAQAAFKQPEDEGDISGTIPSPIDPASGM
jgi:hypothetical protein